MAELTFDDRPFVYNLLSKLTRVTTPQEWLDAVSDYPRSHGATIGNLLWIDADAHERPAWQEIAARYIDDPMLIPRTPIGARMPVESFWSESGAWFGAPGEPTLIGDVKTSPLLREDVREEYLRLAVGAIAFLPIYVSGRWVSAVTYRWSEPQTFTEDDRAAYSAIIQYAGPMISSVRLLEENRARVSRAEQLAEVNAAISRAHTEAELLLAILRFAEKTSAANAILMYIDSGEDGMPKRVRVAGLAGAWGGRASIGQAFDIEGTGRLLLAASLDPELGSDVPAFIEDHERDARIGEAARMIAQAWGVRAGVMLPLRSAGRWQAMVVINWTEPRAFSDAEREIYRRLMPTLASAVASRRSYLANLEAKEEAALLYRLTQQVNAATTYQEIADGLARLYPACDALYIQLWDQLDYEHAEAMEVVAAAVNRPDMPLLMGLRLPKAAVPLLHDIERDVLWVTEDIQNDPRVTEAMRPGYAQINTRASLVVMFMQGKRWLGGMGFRYAEPRQFTDADKRLALGVADVLVAAIERIHSQMQIEAARSRAEEAREESALLSGLSRSINAATSYQEIVDAVWSVYEGSAGVHLLVWENYQREDATYFETLASAAPPDSPLQITGRRFQADLFQPIISQMHETRLWVFEDMMNDPRIDPRSRAAWKVVGIQAQMALPLFQAGRWVVTLTISYHEPRQFNERDQRIAAGVGDLVLAAFERIRAGLETEAARRRADEARAESDFLSELAERINAARTYQEVVDAVYNLYSGSDGLTLSFFDQYDFKASTKVCIAAAAGFPAEINAILKDQEYPLDAFPALKIMADESVWALEDIANDPKIDPLSRHSWLAIDTQAYLGVELRRDDVYIGALGFRFDHPRRFSERDRRMMTSIGELVMAAVERIRSQMETEAARQRSEEAREEATFLYRLAEEINAASTFQEVLDAVALLLTDAEGVLLNIWDNFDYAQASHFDVLAATAKPTGALSQIAGARFTEQQFPIIKEILRDRFWAIEDTHTDTRVDPVTRASWDALDTRAVLAVMLHRGEAWMGGISFHYAEPRPFTSYDRRLHLGIADLILAAIERIRLQVETDGARQRAEEAREENAFLYELAQQINAATGYQEIADAIARLTPDVEGVYINLWEHFDYDRAQHFDIAAAAVNGTALTANVGDRIMKGEMPTLFRQVQQDRLWVVEDTQYDPRMDEEARTAYESFGARASIYASFVQGDRWIGGVAFRYSQPRLFSERERRRVLSIGELVFAAVERIRLQLETEESRQRTEETLDESMLLYKLAQEINAVTTYQEAAEAVVRLYPAVEGVYIQLWEHLDYERAQHIEAVGAALRNGGALKAERGLIVPKERLTDYYQQVRYERPWIVEDISTDPRVHDAAREIYKSLNVQATMVVTFQQGERWIGSIGFRYSMPRVFSEREKRLALGIGELVQGAVERIALQIQTNSARQRSEEAREEASFLYRLAEAVNAATTYRDFVEAVRIIQSDADGIYLASPNSTYMRDASMYDIVMLDLDVSDGPRYHEERIPVSAFPIAETMRASRLFVLEDIANDPRLDEVSRTNLLQGIGAKATLAVSFNASDPERLFGGFGFRYNSPRKFSEREQRQALAAGELMMAAVERIRSQREIEAARLRSEEAREEATFLYRLAEAVNAATTYQEVAEAVLELHNDSDGVYIDIWENFDYESATYLEAVAAVKVKTDFWGNGPIRLPKDSVPLASVVGYERIAVFEDTFTDPRTDEVTRATFKALGTRAFMSVQFLRGDRYIGFILFNYGEPRTFSEREQRLAQGIGDLVLSAIERIRLQDETAAARQHAELLARVSGALTRAVTEDQILAAVDEVAHLIGADVAQLNYNVGHAHDISKVVAAKALREGVPAESIAPVGVTFPAARFPMLRDIAQRPHEIVCLEDMDEDERMLGGEQLAFARQVGWRAMAIIPCFSGEYLEGTFSFIWSTPQVFIPETRTLLDELRPILSSVMSARRAYLAVDEARLETDTARQRAERMARISGALSQAQDEHGMLMAVEELARLTGASMTLVGYSDAPNTVRIVATQLWKHDLPPDGVPPEGMVFDDSQFTLVRAFAESVNQVLYLEDTLNHPAMGTGGQAAFVSSVGWKAALIIPCHSGDRFQGTMSFIWAEPQQWDAATRSVFDELLPIVTSVMKVRRAYLAEEAARRETDIARQRAERLAQVNAALARATDEDSILAAIGLLEPLHHAEVMNLDYAVLNDDGGLFGLRASAIRLHGGVAIPREGLPEMVYRVDDFTALGLMAAHPDRVFFMEDALTDPRPEIQSRLDLVESTGWRAIIAVPLYSGQRWQGSLLLFWKQPQQFSDELRALLEAIRPVLTSVVSARRSYLAAETARRETERRVHELQTVAQVSAAAVTLLDESKLIDAIAEVTQASFRPHRVQLYILDDDYLVNWSERNQEGETAMCISLAVDDPIARAARLRQEVLFSRNVAGELRMPMAGVPAGGYTRTSELAVPMAVRDQIIGALNVVAPQGSELGESDVRVMSTLADLIAVAIHNVRYYEQAQELAALEERTRLARELHDSVSQALYGIGLGAQTARAMLDKDPRLVRGPLEYVITLAEAGLTEMRALIFELRPESLENEGLITALAKQGASLQARHNIEVRLELCDEPTMALDRKESLYRVAREALHNVVKHAEATEIVLRLQRDSGMLVLEVCDNGKGFDTGRDFPGHLGLHSMRERVIHLGGSLEIWSEPGAGARVTARLPHGGKAN